MATPIRSIALAALLATAALWHLASAPPQTAAPNPAPGPAAPQATSTAQYAAAPLAPPPAGIARNTVLVVGADGMPLLDEDAIGRLWALLEAEQGDYGAPIPEEVGTTGLTGPAAQQVRDVLRRLRALQADEQALLTQAGRPEGVEGALHMLQARQALRERHLGVQEARRWFGLAQERERAQIQSLQKPPEPQEPQS